VVGLKDGKLKRTAEGGFVRDDRDRLKLLARAALAWYGRDRSILDLMYRQISGLFKPGYLISTIGAAESSEDIFTTITSVRVDLIAGTTAIQTQFAELDGSFRE
jgi:hypothetical protein